MRTEFSPALDRWPLAPARHRAPQHLPGAAGTGSGAADRGGSAKHRRDPNAPASTNQSPLLAGGGGFSFPSNTTGQMLISPSAGSPPSSIAPVPAPPAAWGVVASSAPQLLGFAWLKRCYHKTPPVAVLCHGHRHGNGLISYPTSAPCTCLHSLPLRDQERARWGSLNLLPPSAPGHRGTMIQNAEQAGDLDGDTTPFSTQGGKSRHSASQARRIAGVCRGSSAREAPASPSHTDGDPNPPSKCFPLGWLFSRERQSCTKPNSSSTGAENAFSRVGKGQGSRPTALQAHGQDYGGSRAAPNVDVLILNASSCT